MAMKGGRCILSPWDSDRGNCSEASRKEGARTIAEAGQRA